jgi:hypothetical protein
LNGPKSISSISNSPSKFSTFPLHYNVRTDTESQPGYTSTHIDILSEFPLEISTMIGNILQDLRSSLDHMAYHLVTIGPGSGPTTRTYFPICATPAKYVSDAPAKVEGMGQGAIDAIRAIEPYQGGNGEILWHLAAMNNMDKHRLLIPVWSNLVAHSLLPSQLQEIIRIRTGSYPNDPIPNFDDTFIAPSGGALLLDDGCILLTAPNSEMKDDMKFRINISVRRA